MSGNGKQKEFWFKVEEVAQEDPDELYLKELRVAGIRREILEPSRHGKLRLKKRRSLEE